MTDWKNIGMDTLDENRKGQAGGISKRTGWRNLGKDRLEENKKR